jgi:hypothetical protein
MLGNKFVLSIYLFMCVQVEYGLADIQGNTFVSIGGKPFLDLRPIAAGTTHPGTRFIPAFAFQLIFRL